MSGKFLLATLGTGGDVLPYLAIGAALRARGHEVVVLAHEHFRPLAEAHGLELDAIGDEGAYDRYIHAPDLWDRHKCLRVSFDVLLKPHMADGYRLVEKHYEPGRTVLVCSSFVFFGRVAQEVLGVPLVSVTLQPCSLFRDEMPPKTTGERVLGAVAGRAGRQFHRRRRYRGLDAMLGWVNEFRSTLDLEPARDIFFDWRYSRQGMLGLWPDMLFEGPSTSPVEFEQPGFVFNDGMDVYSNGNGDGWRRAVDTFDRPPFVFTLGTGMVQGREFFGVAAEACREMDHPGLLVTRDARQLPDPLPDGVKHVVWAPFSKLLPRAGVFVHHGGIGTLARTMAAGTPQLLVPLAYDQFDNSHLARRLGVGGSVLFSELDVPTLCSELERVDTPAMREECRSWSARVLEPDATGAACRYVEARLGRDAETRNR